MPNYSMILVPLPLLLMMPRELIFSSPPPHPLIVDQIGVKELSIYIRHGAVGRGRLLCVECCCPGGGQRRAAYGHFQFQLLLFVHGQVELCGLRGAPLGTLNKQLRS